jgi:hypothetical protein
MTQLNTTADILQHAMAQQGITQQETVGGSLYCELTDADHAERFRKDLQEKVSKDTEVKMYSLGRGIHRDRVEYVYDFVPRTEEPLAEWWGS